MTRVTRLPFVAVNVAGTGRSRSRIRVNFACAAAVALVALVSGCSGSDSGSGDPGQSEASKPPATSTPAHESSPLAQGGATVVYYDPYQSEVRTLAGEVLVQLGYERHQVLAISTVGRLAYLRDDPNSTDGGMLEVSALDGSDETEIEYIYRDLGAAWSHDGETLYYSFGNADTAVAATRFVAWRNLATGAEGRWEEPENLFLEPLGGLAVSPDGRRVAIIASWEDDEIDEFYNSSGPLTKNDGVTIIDLDQPGSYQKLLESTFTEGYSVLAWRDNGILASRTRCDEAYTSCSTAVVLVSPDDGSVLREYTSFTSDTPRGVLTSTNGDWLVANGKEEALFGRLDGGEFVELDGAADAIEELRRP